MCFRTPVSYRDGHVSCIHSLFLSFFLSRPYWGIDGKLKAKQTHVDVQGHEAGIVGRVCESRCFRCVSKRLDLFMFPSSVSCFFGLLLLVAG